MPDGRQPPPIQPLRERLAAQQTRQDEPLVCEDCGSTFFFHVHVHQYSKPTGYMSTELRTITITPIPVRICLCGNIIPPAGSSAIGSPSERSAFQASAELVRKRIDNGNPNQLVKSLASIQELESLRAEVKSLREEINQRNSPEFSLESPLQLDHATGDDVVPDRLPTPAPAGKKKQHQKH
jgi:hypothetical protein